VSVSTRVYETPDELATAVAESLIDALVAAQAEGTIPAVCLTGGSVADRVHREVARLGAASAVDWGAVEFWWGDERYVGSTSPDRNDLQARTAFLDAVGVPARHIHAMPGTGSACSVEEGARAYAAEYARLGRPFLITMLGMGPDGHVASLFPGLAGPEVEEATAIPVVGSPKPPPQRISLTLAALNDAEAVWMLVTGSEKAAVVASALAGPDLPAGRVHGRAGTVWFLDRAAAAQL
jgi:6-phosphogluconolactonase